jgi:lysophospholipase L1-like esterase
MGRENRIPIRRRTAFAQRKAWLLLAALLLNPFCVARLALRDGRIDPPTRYCLAWMGWLAVVTGLCLLLFRREQTRRHLQARWPSYLLTAASVLMALVVAEVVLELADDRLKPRQFHVENYEFRFDVKLNSQGFRDAEFSREKPSGVRRILAIGDSFVYGVGVDEDDSIPRRMEALLNRSGRARYQVFNLGVPGANPTGYAEVARRFVACQPDLALLVFYVDNDVSLGRFGPAGIRRFALWRLFERVSDKLFAEADYAWARNYDIDLFYREKAVRGEINPLLLVRASSFDDEQAYYDDLVRRFESNPGVRAKLIEIRDLFAPVPLLVAIVPSKYQTNPESIPELEKIGFHFRASRVADDGIQRALGAFLKKSEVAFVDLMPEVVASQQQTGRSHYFTIDDHFNELGYELAARVLAERVSDLLEK